MKSFMCCAVLLLLAGSAAAQFGGPPSPAPAPAPGRSPRPPVGGNLTAPNTTSTLTPTTANDTMVNATAEDTGAENETSTIPAEGTKAAPDKRIKAFYDSPKAAAERIPELRELNRLIAASPNATKLLKDKNLTATIFAPNNAAVKGAVDYLKTYFPNATFEELGRRGIVDQLLQYHVTAGNAALTADRIKNGMKLTMLDGSPITIIKNSSGAGTLAGRHLLQAETEDALFIRTNTNQSVAITDTNYQGGKAIIHVIDGVLIPASLAQNYSLAAIPGVNNATGEEAVAPEGTTRGPAGAAPTPAPASAPKSSAGAAVAALLAAPALLAMFML